MLAIKQGLKSNSLVRYNSRQKRAIYISSSLTLAFLAAVILSVWLIFGRPPAAMGLTLQIEGGLWVGPLIAFVMIYTVDTIFSVSTPDKIATAASDWQKRTPFMPTNMNEFLPYLLVCLCAGIFEEVIYRGYLVTYFSFLFRNTVPQEILSIVLPALIFSISHFYHGLKDIIKILVLSILFGYIFLLSGSLVIGMLLHFFANVIGGLLSVKYMKTEIIKDGM